jgi:hypothetical protein
VTGDRTTIVLCKDEDPWTAEVDGEPVPEEQKNGPNAWGANALRTDGRWLVSEIVKQSDDARCS